MNVKATVANFSFSDAIFAAMKSIFQNDFTRKCEQDAESTRQRAEIAIWRRLRSEKEGLKEDAEGERGKYFVFERQLRLEKRKKTANVIQEHGTENSEIQFYQIKI